MPRADFYILNNQGLPACQPFACRLVEKAYLQGHQVYIHFSNAKEMQQFDDLLWTFNDISFIPHTSSLEHKLAPIMLGYGNIAKDITNIAVNLSHDLMNDTQHFKRIIEIVPDNAEFRERARKRFLIYKNQGFELNTHQM